MSINSILITAWRYKINIWELKSIGLCICIPILCMCQTMIYSCLMYMLTITWWTTARLCCASVMRESLPTASAKLCKKYQNITAVSTWKILKGLVLIYMGLSAAIKHNELCPKHGRVVHCVCIGLIYIGIWAREYCLSSLLLNIHIFTHILQTYGVIPL